MPIVSGGEGSSQILTLAWYGRRFNCWISIIMKVFVCLFLVALAMTAEAGMMGPPPGMGGGPGGPPGAMGPPPFVQAMIAAKGKPFGAGGPGGPPGAGGPGGFPGAMGPPPFVQAIIASKGKPFAGGPPAPAAAPEPAAYGAAAPAALGPPDYIQSLMAAKASSYMPFMPPTFPMGPPPFIQQLIAAKNAAAAQQAAEEAAMAQQLAAAQQMGGGGAASPIPVLYHPLTGTPELNGMDTFGTNPFLQNIPPQQSGSPSGVSPGGGDAQTAWIQQLLASQMAKKVSSGDGSSSTSGAQPTVAYSGGWGSPSPTSGLQQRRDIDTSEGQQVSMTPPIPGAYPPFPMGYPPMSPLAPMPFPMMPFFPPMPMWKMMG